MIIFSGHEKHCSNITDVASTVKYFLASSEIIAFIYRKTRTRDEGMTTQNFKLITKINLETC